MSDVNSSFNFRADAAFTETRSSIVRNGDSLLETDVLGDPNVFFLRKKEQFYSACLRACYLKGRECKKREFR